MSPEILIVRERDGYRVLHGHLHLASLLNLADEVIVVASGEGKIAAVKTPDGIIIITGDKRLPLLGVGATLSRRRIAA